MKPELRTRSVGWFVGWCAVTLIVTIVCALELRRVERGDLFLFGLPWDRPPTAHERLDAQLSARGYFWSATAAVSVICMLTCCAVSHRSQHKERLRWRFIAVFAAAAIADLATTLAFFHAQGIDLEFHPAIRLFGDAYGRTVGPIAGKMVQAIAIIVLSRFLGRFGPWLLVLATAIYGIAAAYNLLGTG